MATLTVVTGWIIAVLIALLGGSVVYYIITGKINLEKLISEPNGDASLSRFQFLIFTLVIAMSLFLVVAGNDPPKFPDISAGIFGLLGISGGSYVISKGIQVSRDLALINKQPSPPPSPQQPVQPPPTTQNVQP